MIGHAALAADNQVNGPTAERLAAFLTGDSKTSWPAAKMHTTAVDCYTGERIVVSQAAAQRNGIPLAHGAAASSSLPGIIGPTLLGQRYCMDGGMCSNPAHVDLIAGSKRALIVTLNDGLKPPFLTGIPHPIAENIRQAEATGTKTLWIKADPPNVNLLDPHQILPAIRTGYDRAETGSRRHQGLLGLAAAQRDQFRSRCPVGWRCHRVRYHVTKRVSRPNGGRRAPVMFQRLCSKMPLAWLSALKPSTPW